MRNRLTRTAAACLGFLVLPLAAAHSAINCDASWMGTGVSTAPSNLGHLSVVRGSDGILRANEWVDASQTWSGWFVLPDQTVNFFGDPWVQFVSNPGTNSEAQNIFAVGSVSVKQWILTRSGTTWTIRHRYPVSSKYGTASIQKRIASAQIGTATSTMAGNQMIFATFSDKKVRYQTWTATSASGGSWNGTWLDLGAPVGNPNDPNSVSAPYAVQLTPSTVNLYVRVNGTLYQRYWNGTGWWTNGWVAVPFADYAEVEDPASNYSRSTSEHFLYTLKSTGQNAPSYFHAQKYSNTWYSYLYPDLDRIVKSLAPVNSPNNKSALYGIDAGSSVWKATLDNQAMSFAMPSRVNCVNDFDAP